MFSSRNIIIVFHLVICVLTQAQIKNAKITYHVQLNLKQDTAKAMNFEAERYRQMMLDEVENLQLKLLYNDKVSMFHVPTPVFANKMQESFYKIAKTVAQVNRNYFCDLENGNFIEHVFFEGEEYLIADESNFNWELTMEEKKIEGHNCLKAKTIYTYKSRHGKEELLEVIAWYAPNIPLSLGPRNFSGLPGLILEMSIADNVIVYYATEILLNFKDMMPIELPKNAQLIQRNEYDLLVRKEYNRFFKKN